MGTDSTHDSIETPERSASLTLDQIREGGQALVMLCQARLSEAATAIGEGRFHDGLAHVQQAASKLAALAQAEGALGSLAESFIVRAEEITEGMVIRGHGLVASARREEIAVAGTDPCVHMHFTIEGQDDELEVHGDSEVVIVKENG